MTTSAPSTRSNRTSLHRLAKPSLLASQPRRVDIEPPTKANPLIISASELRDWLRCRVMHHWRHQVKLSPKGGVPNLAIGSLVHNILETWYGLPPKRRTVKRMMAISEAALAKTSWKELSHDDLKLIKAMCDGYAAWAKVNDVEIGINECTPESWFEEPLTPDADVIVRGKIDNTFFPTTLKRTVACSEFKTAGQFKDNIVELNLQLSVYLWALRAKFPKMKRYIAHYTQLRKQMPGPRVKADLFKRDSVEREPEQLDQWARDARLTALDMHGAAVYPNPMDSCAWGCDFKIPCMLRGNPSDLKHVLKTEYVPRTYR
jgi:hypothetical protein